MTQNSILLILLVLLFLSACSDDHNNCTIGQGQIVDGLGEVADFTEVSVKPAGNVMLTQGPAQEVIVRTHASITPVLDTRVTNRSLTIRSIGYLQSVRQLAIRSWMLISPKRATSKRLIGSHN